MARLQILELPEGSGDDRPPFVLIVDQYEPVEASPEQFLRHQNVAEQIGARAVLVFEETIDIPANDTSAYIQQAAEETGATIGNAIRAVNAQHLTDERTDIARDMDRLAKRRDELADALGTYRTCNWDELISAVAMLRKQCDAQGAELERLRAGEEAVTERGVVPTPAQWIWIWNQHTPEKRLDMAAQILDNMAKANECFQADHEAQIASLRGEVERLRSNSSEPDA
jgi:hypothetical protein